MEVIDLTQTISPDMPVYPGTERPRLSQATTIERDGFAEKLLTMYSHTGTHIDAPGHILPGGATLDRFDAGKFVGAGLVVDLAGRTGPGIAGVVGMAELEPYAGGIPEADFVLFRTGWSSRWGSEGYFSGFPVLSPEAARWLCGLGLSGVGYDCISADPVGSDGLPIHRILLGGGLVIVENLRGLDALVGRSFVFSCLPLAIEDADGSPVRAVGIILS
ncbi:MAG: cyclase family protein [Spirochaetes bacterium]|nr:cyclase family protein [Spirochaetota bacterium]MBU1080099.1 cyclase family protein [Spirochaetota bacterium]